MYLLAALLHHCLTCCFTTRPTRTTSWSSSLTCCAPSPGWCRSLTPSSNPNPDPNPDPNPNPNPNSNSNPDPDPDPDPLLRCRSLTSSPNPNLDSNPDPDPIPSPNPNPDPGPNPTQVPLPDVEFIAHLWDDPKVRWQQPLPVFAHYADDAHRDVPIPAPWSWYHKAHDFPQPYC